MSGFVHRNQNGLRQTRTAVKIVLYTLLGTGATIGGGFAGAHAWVESQNPTPSSWNRAARYSYRAAIFNRDYLGQEDGSRIHFEKALQEVLDHETSASSSTSLARLYIMLGDLHRRAGRYKTASRMYTHAAERAIADRRLLGAAARRLGQLQEVEGDTSEAERCLDLAVSSFLPDTLQLQQQELQGQGWFARRREVVSSGRKPIDVPANVRYDSEMIEAVVAYALFRARRGHLQESLETLLSLLRFQQNHPAAQEGNSGHGTSPTLTATALAKQFIPGSKASLSSPNPASTGPLSSSTPGVCLTASTMSTIGEIVWALGSKTEAERWSTDALELCTRPQVKDDEYCGKCAALQLNTLGLLARDRGDMASARRLLERAVITAEKVGDESGVSEFSTNLQSVL